MVSRSNNNSCFKQTDCASHQLSKYFYYWRCLAAFDVRSTDFFSRRESVPMKMECSSRLHYSRKRTSFRISVLHLPLFKHWREEWWMQRPVSSCSTQQVRIQLLRMDYWRLLCRKSVPRIESPWYTSDVKTNISGRGALLAQSTSQPRSSHIFYYRALWHVDEVDPQSCASLFRGVVQYIVLLFSNESKVSYHDHSTVLFAFAESVKRDSVKDMLFSLCSRRVNS